MPGHVQYVVNPPHNPEVAVFVTAAAVTREVATVYLAPIGILVSLGISPEPAQHARPGLANDQFTTGTRRDSNALIVHYLWNNAKEWERSRPRFSCDSAGQRCDHHGTGLGLPPCIHDRTALLADDFVIPNPS